MGLVCLARNVLKLVRTDFVPGRPCDPMSHRLPKPTVKKGPKPFRPRFKSPPASRQARRSGPNLTHRVRPRRNGGRCPTGRFRLGCICFGDLSPP